MPTKAQVDAMKRIERDFGKYITMSAEDFGVPKELLYLGIFRESSGNASAKGPTGDYGISQFKPATAVKVAKELGWAGWETEAKAKARLADPKYAGESIGLMGKYMGDAWKKSGGDPVYAYALYNGGLDRDADLPDVYSRIKDRSLSPAFDARGKDITSNIITNAKKFRDSFEIMGIDPYSWTPESGFTNQAGVAPVAAERPAQANLEPLTMDPRMRPDMPAGGLGPGKRPEGYYGDTPETALLTRGKLKEVYSNPLIGIPARGMAAFNQGYAYKYLPTKDRQEEMVGPPEGFLENLVVGAGDIGGMWMGMGAAKLRGVLGLAGYGLLSKGSAKERLKSGGLNLLLGTGIKASPYVTQRLLGSISPKISNAFVKLMEKRPVRAAHDVPAFTAMGLYQGKDFPDALAGGIGAAGVTMAVPASRFGRTPLRETPIKSKPLDPAMRIGEPAGTDVVPYSRKFMDPGFQASIRKPLPPPPEPGKMDKFAQGGLVEPELIRELAAARAEPIPGIRSSGTLSRNRSPEGRYDIEGVLTDLEAGEYDGYQNPEMRKAVAKQAYHGLKKSRKLEGKTAGETEKLVTDEIDRLILRESLDPDLVAQVEAQADYDAKVRTESYEAKIEGRDPADMGEPPAPWVKVTGMQKTMQPFVSPSRWFAGAGGGTVGYENVLDKVLVRANQEFQEFTNDLSDQLTQEKVDWAKKHGVKQGDDFDTSLTVIAESGLGASESAIVELREIYERGHDWMTRANNAFGGKDFGHIKNYAGPREEKKPATMNVPRRAFNSAVVPFQNFKAEFLEATPEAEVQKTGEWRNPRRMQRTGGTKDPEMSALRRWDTFNQNLAHDIGHNWAINYNQAYARFLEVNGNKAMAEAIRDYSNDVYKGQKYTPFRILSKLGKAPFLSTVNDGLSWTRRQLYNSVFPGNLMWTYTVQPSSSAMGFLNAGAMNSLNGTRLFLSPEFRSMVDGLYSAKIKARGKGSLYNRTVEDESVLMSKDDTNTSLREKALQITSTPGTEMERNLGYWSAANALLLGRQMGLEGRELRDFMSNAIAEQQSMYDQYNRSGMLKSKELNNLLPFKSFLIEIAENVIVQTAPVFRHGPYKQHERLNRERAKRGERQQSRTEHASARLLQLGLAVLMANEYNKGIKGRGVFSPSTIPGYDEMTGSGFAKGGIMSANMVRQYNYGRAKAKRGVREESPALIAQGFVKSLGGIMPWGSMLRRWVDTYAATEGEYPFPVEGFADTAHSSFVGPSSTVKGREWWERRHGQKDGGSALEVEFIKKMFTKMLGESARDSRKTTERKESSGEERKTIDRKESSRKR